jgi:hypothetical protein
MSLNHVYKNSALSQNFDLGCRSIVISGNSFSPPVSNSYSSTPIELSPNLELGNATGYYTVTSSSTGRKFITLTAKLTGVVNVATNVIDFILRLPTGYKGLVGNAVILTGDGAEASTGLVFKAFASNINPSNTSQAYLLFINSTAISGTFTFNLSITTEVTLE